MLPRRALERAVEESERLGLFDLAVVEFVLRANHRRPGTGKLRAVVQEHRVGTTLTHSELEERLLVVCDRYGLERPLVNIPLLGFEVDFLWPAARVVETDGHASHGTRAAFERDRARDAHLTAASFRVVRLTHRQLKEDAGAVADVLSRVLNPPSA